MKKKNEGGNLMPRYKNAYIDVVSKTVLYKHKGKYYPAGKLRSVL